MRWVAFRRRAITTRVGEAELVRGYWHCDACGTGCAPDDEVWDLPPGNSSWGVRDVVSMLGALLAGYTKIAHLLEDLTLFQISDRSIENWTEEVGAAYVPPMLAPEDPGPTADLVVIEADACTTLWRTDYAWHDQKVYAAWSLINGVEQPIVYATAQGPWKTHDALVENLARRVGVRQAQEVLCLADGAAPIWKLFSQLFPDAFQLLDWYHLMEHLGEVAKVHSDGDAWLATQQEALRFRGPRETLYALKALHQQGVTAELQQAAGACLIYMWHHRHRMDYPEARRRGYPIGSGRIESAVKQVVQARAKQAGMSWNPEHLQKVLTARCALLSGDWELACAQTKAKKRAQTLTVAPPRDKTAPTPILIRRQKPNRTNERPISTRQIGQMVKKAFGL